MKYPISTDVIGLRGNALGCRGVVKALLPDDHYEVFFPGLGQYTVAESTIMSVDEFKALQFTLARAQRRIAELETIVAEVVEALEISHDNNLIRLEVGKDSYVRVYLPAFNILRRLLDLSKGKEQ